MVLLTASTYIKNDLTQLATIVGYSKSDLPNTLISTAQLYFPTANAYFFTGDKDLVGLGISGNLVAPDRLDDSQLQIIDTVTSQSGTGKIVPISWLDKQNVFAFSQPIGNLGTSFMVIVPQTYVTSQLEGIGPVNIALVGIAMLIIGFSAPTACTHNIVSFEFRTDEPRVSGSSTGNATAVPDSFCGG